MSSSPLNFQLEHYEGPLDLLLDLIRKQQINIHDIPIASITQQYLAYLEKAAALDMELGAEFIFMAATLIHIKSRLLLPRDPELEKITQEEDPRKELVDRLLEHERFKNAAEMLQQKRLIEEAVWSNPQIQDFVDTSDGPALSVTLFDLVKTLETVLERARSRPVHYVDKEDVTIPDMVRFLGRVMHEATPKQAFSARDLFERQRSSRAMICLFLAILELVKRQAIALEQSESFGEIVLKKEEGFEQALAETESAGALGQDYN